MNGVEIPSVSPGSSQREASVMWTPQVMVPTGAGARPVGWAVTGLAAPKPRTSATKTMTARDVHGLMGSSQWRVSRKLLTRATQKQQDRTFVRQARALPRDQVEAVYLHAEIQGFGQSSGPAPEGLPGHLARRQVQAAGGRQGDSELPVNLAGFMSTQVWRSPTAAARASSSARQDAGATTGRTTNLEKPTAMKRSMSSRNAGSPTGVSSGARGRRAAITRAVAGSMGAPA